MKNKMNESYEDQVLAEFEKTQPQEEPNVVTDLGNINDHRPKRDDVMPEFDDDNSIELRDEDLEITAHRSSGAGGQHVNKTSSAVRLIHKPMGTVVECQQERSQFQNREKAMRILASRLYEQQEEKLLDEYSAQRRNQVGSGMRNERIRTYNFPQGRVTDHRIALTLYKLDSVMDGDLNELIDALTADRQAELLKQQQFV